MLRKTFLLAFVLTSAFCGEPAPVQPLPQPPDASQITQALERGKSIRDQKGVVQGALIKSAVTLKVGDVRNGSALVKIEDGRADGAVYKLTERLKVAMPEGNDMIVTDYMGVLLLAADLALVSGKQVSTRTVTSNKKTETSIVTADIFVNGTELSWTKKEKRNDEPEMLDPKTDVKLHGVRPMPRNAIIALAAFAATEPNFSPGISSPMLVPTMDMGITIDEFLLQPAWISFELPKDKTKPEIKMMMTVRFLDGEINDKGLKVEPPFEAQWNEDLMQWTYDQKMQVINTPAAGEAMIQTETTDPEKINVDEPLDFEKLKAEVKKIDDKINKEKEKELQELIKNTPPPQPHVPKESPKPQPVQPKPGPEPGK